MFQFRRGAVVVLAGSLLMTGSLALSSAPLYAQEAPSFKDPDKLKAWNDYVESVNKGVQAINAKQYNSAAVHLNNAIAQGEAYFPNTAWLAKAYGYLGSAHARAKEYKQAIEPYNKALNIYIQIDSPQDVVRNAKMLGFLYAQSKQYKKALESYQTVVLMAELGIGFPEDVKFSTIMRDMATVYKLSGKPEAAEETYAKALPVLMKQNPKDPVVKEIAMQLADIKFEKGKLDEALKLYQMITKDVKGNSFTLDEISAIHKSGRILLTQEKFTEAAPLIDTAILGFQAYNDKASAQRDLGIAHVDKGILLFKTGQFEASAAELEKGANILKTRDAKSPPMFDALNLLVEVNYKLERPQQAKQWAGMLKALGGKANELITKDPRIKEASQLAQQAIRHHQEGESKQAETKYKKAIALFDQAKQGGVLYARLNNNLGRLYLEDNKTKQALPYMQKAVEISKERGSRSKQHAEMLTGLGQALMGNKKNKDAIKSFEDAIKIVEDLDGKDAKSLIYIYDNYAEALTKAKRKKLAKKYEAKSQALRKKYKVPANVKFFGIEG